MSTTVTILRDGLSCNAMQQRFLVRRVTSSSTVYYQEIIYARARDEQDKAVFTDDPNSAQEFHTYGDAERQIRGFVEDWHCFRDTGFQIDKIIKA